MKSRHAKTAAGSRPPPSTPPPAPGASTAPAAVDGLGRAGRLARGLERLAGAQQRLGRDAAPIGALAAEQLALGDRDPQAAVRQPRGAVLAGRPAAGDEDVEGGAHADPFALSISYAAVMRPMCEYAWGKLPSCSPLAVSISSPSRPRSFAYPASCATSASARSSSPACARHETSQNEQMTNVPSSPLSPSAPTPSSAR